ncbi:hypothetical protein N7456_009059 [Penicillium angulare]|uniref:Carboxypeptidase n=1 Tax=Penicillium angulare TaxID=116970 RepID=A0A9W9F3X0_9EURO|nr:hypothetical protein N7456_009059 [Penicillium angulare]
MRITSWGYFFLPLIAVSECRDSRFSTFARRQHAPTEPEGVKTIQTANNVTIRYKEPGKEGICETTPGVNSYSGYVNLAPDSHTFFWFFEARHDPENAPITLWLNGGPGSDSLIGLFQEMGPCHINKELESYLNPHSWNEVSNVLFISQPVGVGFSYSGEQAYDASLRPVNSSSKDAIARYPTINATKIDTTELAAKATWEILQGFLSALPQLDSTVKSKSFNLWTESYGGHYGPAFFDHFYSENQKLAKGTTKGMQLDFNSLGIINGIIDQEIQSSYFPEFAVNNTYGIKAVNDSVYSFMKYANEMPEWGCLAKIQTCKTADLSTPYGKAICAEAAVICKDAVQGPYYAEKNRGSYDIRHPAADPTPPPYFNSYLAKGDVLNAIGVDLNYSQSNPEVLYAFQQTGDLVYTSIIQNLNHLLSLPVRVSLIYGDADYTCNWFGGEAVSLAANYTHSKQFREAGYTPFMVNGTQYGETREYGNFSFTRVYEAGHMVPYYQPEASLQLFNRTLNGWEIATGEGKNKPDQGSDGPSTATHTQSSVALPTASSSSVSSSSALAR